MLATPRPSRKSDPILVYTSLGASTVVLTSSASVCSSFSVQPKHDNRIIAVTSNVKNLGMVLMNGSFLVFKQYHTDTLVVADSYKLLQFLDRIKGGFPVQNTGPVAYLKATSKVAERTEYEKGLQASVPTAQKPKEDYRHSLSLYTNAIFGPILPQVSWGKVNNSYIASVLGRDATTPSTALQAIPHGDLTVLQDTIID